MYRSFYFVRHGETDWNKQHVFQGHNDIPLNEAGRQQAKELGKKLILKDDAMVFSSPLKRARETAQIVIPPGHQINFLSEFMECNSPACAQYLLELKGVSDMPSFEKLNKNGESPEELLERVDNGLNKMFELAKDKTPYLFAHGGICTAICKLLDIEFFKTPNCGIFHFAFVNNSFIVRI